MISLNSHYIGTVYPIGLSLDTFVADYHINVQMKKKLYYLFTLGIKGAQSWSISGSYMIFAFFSDF